MATPIADYIGSLDSHGLYDAADVGQGLREAGYTGNLPEGYTHKAAAAMIEARGLGGSLAPDNGALLIGGYEVAGMIVQNLTGSRPGAMFYGRGSAYRADLQAIRAWEEAQTAAPAAAE